MATTKREKKIVYEARHIVDNIGRLLRLSTALGEESFRALGLVIDEENNIIIGDPPADMTEEEVRFYRAIARDIVGKVLPNIHIITAIGNKGAVSRREINERLEQTLAELRAGGGPRISPDMMARANLGAYVRGRDEEQTVGGLKRLPPQNGKGEEE